jgi:hypothetical protein
MSTLYPYANFMENEETYLKIQEVWSELITHIASVNGFEVDNYMDLNQQQNPVRDGNPIVALKLRGGIKGIRVILVDPAEDGGDFSAWFNEFGIRNTNEYVSELVFDMKLSHATLGISAILIERWFTERLPENTLEEWLKPWSVEEE